VSLAVGQYIHPEEPMYSALASTQTTVLPANYTGSVLMTPDSRFRANLNGDDIHTTSVTSTSRRPILTAP